ncbi:hypothetical protein ENSA5_58150 [Enhygromyxa salina]|uniref:Uncharacterized protein n=1 Tax=Enhygromyxa salina TaxID=215803 RepID=A0A2S9XDY0_9BACT|nr:hypothetical protein ENSA5_58150 [Enhygromyxa salina]
MCSNEDDWYLFSVNDLDYEVYALYVDAIVMGSSWCGQWCDEPFLPAAPENAIAVEVFDAESMMPLTQDLAQDGRIDIGGFGDAYSRDVLIHVYGPTPAATYPYELSVEIRGYDGEDECEC